jgi:hypothetical protein
MDTSPLESSFFANPSYTRERVCVCVERERERKRRK